MKKILLSALVLGMLFAGTKNAAACKPGPDYPLTLQEAYDSNDGVFVGRVVSVTPDRIAEGDATITFDIEYAYKGNFGDPQVVKTAGSSAACGFDDPNSTFKEGDVWLIFAKDGQAEGYRTTSLMPNKKYSSVIEAKTEADPLKDNTVMCTMQYDPKCGTKNGVQKTYGNACLLGADKADFVRDGECAAAPGATTVTGTTGAAKPTVAAVDGATVTASTTEPAAELSWWQKLWQGIKNVIFFWK